MGAFIRFKGGRLPVVRKPEHVALSDHMGDATTWPPAPPQGWEAAVDPSSWGMLGNDQYGDCACAGIMHTVQAQSANAGNPLSSTTDQTLNLYSAITGFNPSDPSTDQGTVLSVLLDYIVKNGLEMYDATRKVVTVEVVGYAGMDISSTAQMRYGTYIFGSSYLGINCPEQCEQDLSNWNFASGLAIAGGHCISRPGEGAAGGQIITWGQKVPFSNGFWSAYGEEAWIVLTKSWLNNQNQSPTGLNLDSLVAAMNQYKQSLN